MLKGCDISEWQGEVNFTKLKKVVDFVIIRSSFGNGYYDKYFARNRDEARKAGIPRGFYHYAYPNSNTPEQEAEWFVKHCVYDLQEGEFLALDFEESYPDPALWCERFLNHVSYLMNGYKPLLYINLALANNDNTNWKPIINAGYGLWVAYWNYDPNNDNFDTPWPFAAFRQWSNQESFNGISGRVDANIFYGEMPALIAYGYHPKPNAVPIPPEEKPQPLPIDPPVDNSQKTQEPVNPSPVTPSLPEEPKQPEEKPVEPTEPKIEPTPENTSPDNAPKTDDTKEVDVSISLFKEFLLGLKTAILAIGKMLGLVKK